MEAHAKIKKYEETVKHLYKLLKKVCEERDDARDHLQLLMRNLQESTPADTNSTIPHACLQYKKTKPSLNSTKGSDSSSKVFSNHSCDLSLSTLQANEKHSSMDLLPKQPNHIKADMSASRDKMIDSASLVIDKLVCGKSLPQKGKLLQTVTETGPLLHTLLVAPVPQWQNPPPLCSSCLPLSGNKDNSSCTNMNDDKASVNPNESVPTSLSLAFTGNSHGPSQMSSAFGFGLSLKNEPVSYVDMDSNHVLNGKKRKLL